MGRAIIGGVITSTLFTLVVVPVLYSYLVRDRSERAVSPGLADAAPDRPVASGAWAEHAPADRQ